MGSTQSSPVIRWSRKPSAIDRVMSEVVRVPGFPQIVVTREWLHFYLKNLGWNMNDHGFGGAEYLTMRPSPNEPLTDAQTRDYYMMDHRVMAMFDRRLSTVAGIAA